MNSAPAMTEDEMVRSLIRDHGLDRAVAQRVARDALLRESVSGAALPKAQMRMLVKHHAESPPLEADIQMELLERLVGPAVKGQPRAPGGGISSTYPDLGLVYAINPNAGAVSQRNAKRSKAMGLLADLPDLHLPVMRGPFLTLYVELKRPGELMRPGQRARAAQLREQGHCVLEIQSVQDGITAFVSYLDLPPNRPSARALNGNRHFTGTLEERIHQWRAHLQDALQPARRKAHG